MCLEPVLDHENSSQKISADFCPDFACQAPAPAKNDATGSPPATCAQHFDV